jgi:hypothetical protein
MTELLQIKSKQEETKARSMHVTCRKLVERNPITMTYLTYTKPVKSLTSV